MVLSYEFVSVVHVKTNPGPSLQLPGKSKVDDIVEIDSFSGIRIL